jgi:hypothetical protein
MSDVRTNMLTAEDDNSIATFRSETLEINLATDVQGLYKNMKKQMENHFANYLRRSSGW